MFRQFLLLQRFLDISILFCLIVNGIIYNLYRYLKYMYTLITFLGSYIENNIYHVPLNEDNLITLDWQIDYISENLIFEVHLPSNFKWFAIGFSNRGELFPADYCVLWYNWKHNVHLQVSQL